MENKDTIKKGPSLFKKVSGAVGGIKTHWNTPKEGNYVPYKEVVAFSAGGVGVKTVNAMVAQIAMSVTCLLIASVYQLSPSNIFILFVISNIISVLKTPIVSWLVDNTNTKRGKFRPYLLWAGIPCLVGVIGVTWLVPVNGTPLAKMITIGIFYNILYIGQHVYNNAYVGISQVISPNSNERTTIMSISEFVANLGPSIVQLVLPIFAQLFFGKEGLLDLQTYRILLPAFTLVGFLGGLVVMAKTKERVVKPKDSVEKVKMTEGLKQFATNREFWIVSISRFFEGFRGTIGTLLPWVAVYQLNQSAMVGILVTIVSTASVPGMLLAPWLIKKFGFKKVGFFSFLLNTIAALFMLLTFQKHVAFLVIGVYLYNLAAGPQYIIQTSLTADALDEQQLKTGERIEGFVQNIQLMFSVIGSIVSTFVLTIMYESNGLIADTITGLTDYGVLGEDMVRNPIIAWSIVIALIASVLSALPFLLSKMTEAKHTQIINKLEEKANVASKDNQID